MLQLEKIHLFITDECNLACPTCFVNASGRFNDELSYEEWIDVLGQLNKMEIKETHLEGGEPFLRHDLVSILTKYRHISSTLIATNGTVSFKPEFKKLNSIKRLSISIESYNQFNQNIAKGSDLKKVIANLIKFRDNGFYINTNTVLTSINYREMREIVERGIELKIQMVRFAMFEIVGRGINNIHLKLNKDQWKEVIREYLILAKEYKDEIIITLGLPSYGRYLIPSDLPIFIRIQEGKQPNQFAITAEGSVYPCASLINFPAMKWGNIRKTSIEAIINNHLNDRHPCKLNNCNPDMCSTILLST